MKLAAGRIMGAPGVSIGATMFVCFFVAFGLMMWQRRHEPAAPSGAPPGLAFSRPASGSGAAHRLAPTPVPSAAPTVAAPAAAAAPTAAATPSESSEDIPSLPVRVAFRHPAKLDRTVARLINESSDSVSLEVLVQSAKSGRSVSSTLDVMPMGQATVGADEGYDLESGDQVTLRAQSFRDLVLQVP